MFRELDSEPFVSMKSADDHVMAEPRLFALVVTVDRNREGDCDSQLMEES